MELKIHYKDGKWISKSEKEEIQEMVLSSDPINQFFTNARNKQGPFKFVLAKFDDKIIGWAAVKVRLDKNDPSKNIKTNVVEVFVQEEYRRNGLGSRLLELVIRKYKHLLPRYQRKRYLAFYTNKAFFEERIKKMKIIPVNGA